MKTFVYIISLKWLLVILIRFYQVTLSQLWSNKCRFSPSCSSYTILAIKKHGALKGVFLGVKRILRCSPLFEGGVDAVPDSRRETKWLY